MKNKVLSAVVIAAALTITACGSGTKAPAEASTAATEASKASTEAMEAVTAGAEGMTINVDSKEPMPVSGAEATDSAESMTSDAAMEATTQAAK